MKEPSGEQITRYLSSIFGGEVTLRKFESMGGSEPSIKEYGYGRPYSVMFEVNGLEKEAVISTSRVESGFGHDYRSDRASGTVLSYDTWNTLPSHAKVFDLGYFTKDGDMHSIGNFDEFFLMVEKIEGSLYQVDLDRILSEGQVADLDLERARALSEYLVHIHSQKKNEPGLYIRKLRDTLGHGECIFGLSDSYPESTDFLRKDELLLIEQLCLKERWRLRKHTDRLSRVHGDFHPWNIIFTSGIQFRVLDRSRGEWGEPADDVAGLTINYIFQSLRRYGKMKPPFGDLFKIFIDTYMEKTGDKTLFTIIPLFYAFRCLVLASPIWYPSLANETRRKILNFAVNLLETESFDPNNVNRYFGD